MEVVAGFVAGMYVAWTLPFFLFIGLIFVVACIDTYRENFTFACWLLVIWLGVSFWTGTADQILHILMYAPVVVVGYLVAGTLWSFIRFYLYSQKIASIYDEARANGKSVKEAHSRADEACREYGGFPLRVSRCKMFIFTSIVYWPVSIIWYFFHDVISDALNWILRTFGGVYQRVADGGSEKYRIDTENELAAARAAAESDQK